MHSHTQHRTPHYITHHIAPQPKLANLLCENSGAIVGWLMDKFNLDVSLVARLGGHSAPRTYRDHHLCFDSDGEEDCEIVVVVVVVVCWCSLWYVVCCGTWCCGVCESWWCWCSLDFVCVSLYLWVYVYRYLHVWSVCVYRCI